MMTKNTCIFFKNPVVRVLTAIFIISSVPTQTRAQLTPGYQVSIKFPPVADRGAPERTSPGGRRGGCDLKEATPSDINSRIELTAIAPINNIITSVVPHPAVYVHIATIMDEQVNFRVLEKETNIEVYKTNFQLPHTAGIVKVKLPETVNLQANKIYNWEFLVICDPEDSSDDKLVKGLLERKSLTLEQLDKIEKIKENPIEQAKLYAEYGVWHETLEILDSLRENSQFKAEWDEILSSVKLQQLANYPVINCCQVANSSTVPTTTNNIEKPKPDFLPNTGWGGN